MRPDQRSWFLRLARSQLREVFTASGARSGDRDLLRSRRIFVARDERETAPRAAQSRPHLRPCAGSRGRFSDRLLHGEAVALGMVLAFGFSRGSA